MGVSRKRHASSSSSSPANPVDLIENLPEAIISRILSTLPTKDAVATSILSRSWRYRWTKITSFYFEDTDESSENEIIRDDGAMGFSEFIHRALGDRGGDSIDRFLLRWESAKLQSSCLNSWVDTTIARNVRVLDLKKVSTDTPPQNEFVLPLSLYISGTLEVLRLKGPFRVKPPKLICLPKLYEMSLSEVMYESDESFHNLISGCLVLKSLEILRENEMDDLVVCSISSPNLTHLVIDFQEPDSIGISGNLKLKINAPALEFLHLSDHMSSHISIQPRCIKVRELALNVTRLTDKMLVQLFQAFGSVLNNLTLHGSAMKAVLGDKLPVCFGGLARLSIHTQSFPQGSRIMDFLGSCIKLEEFQIWCEESVGDGWSYPACVPRCLLSSLRSLTLAGFDGIKKEMEMLKFFLDHGLVLQRVEIMLDGDKLNDDDAERFKVLNKVSRLSRASATCKISCITDSAVYNLLP